MLWNPPKLTNRTSATRIFTFLGDAQGLTIIVRNKFGDMSSNLG